MPLNELSASEAAQLIAAGEITSEDLVKVCLARIAEREPVLKAWSSIDPEHALRQARERDKGPRLGPLHGMPVAAESLDTIGVLARTVDDLALLANVLVNRPSAPGAVPSTPPRIGFCRTYLWQKAKPESQEAVESAAAQLAAAGANIQEISLPADFSGLTDGREIINNYERARGMAHEWRHHREQLSPQLAKTVQLGLETPYQQYADVLRMAESCRAQLPTVFADVDVLLAPAATGEAPLGRTGPGIRPSRACGHSCTSRPSACRPIAGPTTCRSTCN